MADFDLERFVSAQADVYPQVTRELGAGAKRTHWMWFIFPQLRGLGRSPTAVRYGLEGRAEAAAYLAHPVLGARLVDCTGLVNHVEGRTALQVFGSPDEMKFRSCMTLFATLRAEPFETALGRYFSGERDLTTLEMINAA